MLGFWRDRRTGLITRLLACMACCIALASCSSVNSMLGGSSEQDALKKLKWSYAADGLQINVQADPALNEFDGQPHMLAVTVVQMENTNAFTQETASADKIKDLLLAQTPPKGMLALQRVFIAPGEKRLLQLPRVEKAQYVGLVVGYNHLDPASSSRLYRIGVQVDSSGMIIKTRTAAPETLKINLNLGPDGIQGAPGSKVAPTEPTKPQAGLVTPPAQTSPATRSQSQSSTGASSSSTSSGSSSTGTTTSSTSSTNSNSEKS